MIVDVVWMILEVEGELVFSICCIVGELNFLFMFIYRYVDDKDYLVVLVFEDFV